MMTITALNGFKHTCTPQNAERFRKWIAERGGVAVWKSVSLSNPGSGWSTPALSVTGEPYTKPHWDSDEKPAFIVTREDEVGVVTEREVKRFRVAVRRGTSNPMLLKLTDASSRKLHAALEKLGEDARHVFDYETQEAVILVPESIVSLSEWKS